MQEYIVLHPEAPELRPQEKQRAESAKKQDESPGPVSKALGPGTKRVLAFVQENLRGILMALG